MVQDNLIIFLIYQKFFAAKTIFSDQPIGGLLKRLTRGAPFGNRSSVAIAVNVPAARKTRFYSRFGSHELSNIIGATSFHSLASENSLNLQLNFSSERFGVFLCKMERWMSSAWFYGNEISFIKMRRQGTSRQKEGNRNLSKLIEWLLPDTNIKIILTVSRQ
jgi:hypothetical protein